MVTLFPEDLEHPSGGVEAVAACLVRSLLRHGVEVTLIHLSASKTKTYVHPELGCTVYALKRARFAGVSLATFVPRQVSAILKEVKPDLVHVQGLPEALPAFAGKKVLTVHGIAHKNVAFRPGLITPLRVAFRRFLFFSNLKKYDHVISISPYVISVVGADRLRDWTHIENPVESCFYNIERDENSRSILYVGVVSRQKNLVELVEAVAKMKDDSRPVSCRIAGPLDSAYVEEVEAVLQRHALSDRFEFLGSLDRGRLEAELASCACLVLPSRQETAPRAILEAMAAGVPIVASRVGGTPSMVEHGETGLLYDCGDTDQLASHLSKLLESVELRRSMGEKARAWVTEAAHEDKVAERTIGVYRDLLE